MSCWRGAGLPSPAPRLSFRDTGLILALLVIAFAVLSALVPDWIALHGLLDS